MSERSRFRRAVLTAFAGVVITTCVCLGATWATAAPQPSGSRPVVAATTAAPAPSPTGCYAVLYKSLWYCRASISVVSSTAYRTGKRVVLTGVSVTSHTTSTVTVSGLEWPPCPPGMFCGASATVVSLTVRWSGSARPADRTVVDLYGVTTTGNLTPVGYVRSTNCYIDWC